MVANTKHLWKEINIFRAGSKLRLEGGKPSVRSCEQMWGWHMDHMVRAVLHHNSRVPHYSSGFDLRTQTCRQKLHSLVHPLTPCEKAGDFAGFCFPSLGEMKAQHRPSVPKAIVAGLRDPAMALCCRDLLSCCNLPPHTHGRDALLYPSEITVLEFIEGTVPRDH